MFHFKKKLKIVLLGVFLVFLTCCATREKNLPKFNQLSPKPRIGIVNLLEAEAKLVCLKDYGKYFKKHFSVNWEIPNYMDKKLTEILKNRLQSEVVILPANQEIIKNKDKLYGFWPKCTDRGVNVQALGGITELSDANKLDVVIFVLSYHKLHLLGSRNIVNRIQGNIPTGFSGYGLFITEGAISSFPGLGMVKVPRIAAPFASIAIEAYWTRPPYAYMGGSGPDSIAGGTCSNVPSFQFPENIENMSMPEFNQIESELKIIVDQLIDVALKNAGLAL